MGLLCNVYIMAHWRELGEGIARTEWTSRCTSIHQGRNTPFSIIIINIIIVVVKSFISPCLLNHEGLEIFFLSSYCAMQDVVWNHIWCLSTFWNWSCWVYFAQIRFSSVPQLCELSWLMCGNEFFSDIASEKGLEVSLKHWGHVRCSSMMRCFQSPLHMVQWNFTVLLHTEIRASCYLIWPYKQHMFSLKWPPGQGSQYASQSMSMVATV